MIHARFGTKPEVMYWKKDTLQAAAKTGYTSSIFGRQRTLAHLKHKLFKHRMHSERAGINHIIQGSAADIVMLSMMGLHKNARLKYL